MNQISSITTLLNQSDCQFRFFDIGRKLTKISKKDFISIENNQLPYPFPIKAHAEFAVIFWQQHQTEPFFWFVKLPLDEKGLLNLTARNHFIAIIIEALGQNVSQKTSQRQDDMLKNNPYHITPAPYKLAALNSILKLSLKQKPSTFFSDCVDYFSAPNIDKPWHHIGLQGICDLAARAKEKPYDALMANALPKLPFEVLQPLLAALENQEMTDVLVQSILVLLKDALTDNDDEKINSCLRSLASCCEHPHVKTLLSDMLSQDQMSINSLLIIAGRCWPILEEHDLALCFLEKLAKLTSQTDFNIIFQDIVAIPQTRPAVLASLRNPSRTAALSHAIGGLFNKVNQQK